MKYLIEETTLTGIADAVRGKNGTTDLIPVSNLATEISNLSTGGSAGFEQIKIDNMRSFNEDGLRSSFFTTYANYFKYRNVKDYYQAFYNVNNLQDLSGIEVIYRNTEPISNVSMQRAFAGSGIRKLFNIVKSVESTATISLSHTGAMFQGCHYLREIPETFFDAFDVSNLSNSYKMFEQCMSLRYIPGNMIKNLSWSGNYHFYKNAFSYCYNLDAITKLPLYSNNIYSEDSNMFSQTFDYCNRLSRVMFHMPKVEGVAVPGTIRWSNQTIDLSQYVGYAPNSGNITDYNSGITADKQVNDDATYQALKNDPDWFATDINYSRYNHNSAVETINSLPDTSAYLATNGGTNTIIFSANSGTKTDGGAIGNLSEEEIAVATAKGWTVQLV